MNRIRALSSPSKPENAMMWFLHGLSSLYKKYKYIDTILHKTTKLYVNIGLLGCSVMWTYRQITTLHRNIMPPSSALKMEAMCSSDLTAGLHGMTTNQHQHLQTNSQIISSPSSCSMLLADFDFIYMDFYTNVCITS
jgi:hypothetical protein